MKKVLQKTLFRLKTFLLLAVMFIVGSSASWAETETINFAGSWNGTYVTVSGTNASDWGYDPALVIYQNYKGTFTAKSGYKITRMEFTMGSMGYGTPTVSEGTMTSSTVWENASGSTSILVSASDMKMYSRVTVTVVGDGGSTPGGGDQGGGEDGDDEVLSTFNFNGTNTYTGTATGTLTGGKPFYDGFVFTGSGTDAATMTINAPGMNSDPNSAGWSNSGERLFIKQNVSFTIAVPEGFEMTKIAFATDANTISFASKSGLSGSSRNYTWTGNSSEESFTMSANSWIKTVEVTLVSIVEEGIVTYNIDLVDAPTGAYVTLDGQRFEDDGTYSVEKTLGKNDLEAFEPEGYYAEVEYTRDSHTYTVTYHAYNYYDVTVTGTEDPAAGVVYNNQTYGNGSRIETKAVLTESSVTAAEVSGMKGTVSMSGNTFNVDYQEKLDFVIMTNTGLTTYTNDEFKVTVTGVGTMGNCINLWSTWKATVTSEIFPIERIELEEGRNNYVITATSDPVGYNNMVWTGTPTNKVTFTAAGGDWEIKSVHVYLYKPQPVNYTFEFVNAPDEAYITIDGQTINKVNDGYTVAKVFTAESVTSVYEPDGYYADVEYNEENHKFTITYHQGSYVSFGNSWEQKEEITYDPYWSGGSVYQTSWDGYGRVFFRCSTKKITKIELRFDGDASPIIDGNGFGSVTANGNTAIWTAPAEGTATDICIYSTSSDGRNVVSSKVFYEALPDIDYPVVIAVDGTLPADFTPSVTVDGENFTESGTHSTPKTLTGSEASATTPDNGDWYYDVAYAEDTHTFTVTYKEYLHYIVSVVDCEDETAGVRMGYETYHNGDKINVKETLTAESLTAVTVNGYDVEAPVVGDGTVTVTYTVAGMVNYAVTITGMPEGASVKIEDDVYSENTDNGVHQSNKTLSSEVVTIQNCPETHYTNDSNEWFDAEGKAFNIAFTPYLVYTVAVDEASAYQGEEAGVKVFNARTYLPGQPIYNKTALTESDVKAADVDGYTGTVTLADNVFTVSYTKNDFIVFDASKFTQDGGYGNLDETIEGVRLQCWDSGEYFGVNNRSNSHIVLSSSEAPIVKVEAEYISWGKPSYGYATIDGKNTGELNTEDDFTTWTGSTNDLELWDSTNNTAYVSSIKVYLAQPTTYHVNIAGMPEQGATVIVNYDYDNGYYTADGNYDYVTYDELSESSITAIAPESHQVDKTYNVSTKTFEITYTALPEYTYAIAIYPQDKADEFKIWIDGNEYGDTGMGDVTFYRLLTELDIYAPEQAGYESPAVTITNLDENYYLIDVTYTALPTLAIGSSAADSEGNYWTSFCLDKAVSFPAGVTPCIVTGAENGKLTLKELPRVSNEVTTTYDFENNAVEEIFGNLYCEGDNHDVVMSCSGLSVYQSIGGKGYLKNEGTLNISCLTTPITKVIVKPWGWGTGANISLNGADPVAVADGDDTYTFDVNSYSCTLDITNYNGGVYLLWIEVVTSSGETVPVIPANTGILVKSEAPIAKILYAVHEEGEVNTDVSANILSASGETGFSKKNDADNLYYKLTLNAAGDEGSAGFYWDKNSDEGHSINVPAHKAYLRLPVSAGSNRAVYHFGGEDVLTGVESISTEANNAPVYNLQGQRVNATKAGVYVKNGKKFIVK